MIEAGALGAALLAAWGEIMTIERQGGGSAAVSAVYRRSWQGRNEFGLPLDRPEPEVQLRATEFAAAGAAPGDTILRADGTTRLAIVDAAAQEDDWIVCRVREL